jgi:hypothetical protein
MSTNKDDLSKRTERKAIWADGECWTVHKGNLHRHKKGPNSVDSLFKLVAEKIPFDAINAVEKNLQSLDFGTDGVYIAHDSMGCPRYIGRGNVINRLKARKWEQPLELEYFSFYIVEEKKHEREIETIMIRAAGPLLVFNDKKKRNSIDAGDIKDYEAGTLYYERHWKKGK